MLALERRKLILDKLQAEKRVVVSELSQLYNVSEETIRRDLDKLEKEGLVTIEPRRGAYASQISVKDMVDILEVRQNLEGLAAFFAAQRMTKDVQEELHRVSENYDQAVADGDMAAMIKSDTRFHRIIVEASNNHVLLQMIEQLQELVLRFRYLYYSDFKRADDMPSEHEAIYEAIVAGDADAAREAADIHIQRLKELVISEGV